MVAPKIMRTDHFWIVSIVIGFVWVGRKVCNVTFKQKNGLNLMWCVRQMEDDGIVILNYFVGREICRIWIIFFLNFFIINLIDLVRDSSCVIMHKKDWIYFERNMRLFLRKYIWTVPIYTGTIRYARDVHYLTEGNTFSF